MNSPTVHRMTFVASDFYDRRGNNFASHPVRVAFSTFARGMGWTPPVVGHFAGTDALAPIGEFSSTRWPNIGTIYDR